MEADVRPIPDKTQKIIKSTSTSSIDVCPLCHGSGWELYIVSAEALTSVYGDEAVPLEYAKRCTKCNGITSNSFDNTGVPEAYHECDIYRFDFDIYKTDMAKKKTLAFSMLNNYKEWAVNAKGLYIYSKTPGSGKTYLACCLGKSIMMKHGIRFKFITAPAYLDKVSEGYSLAKQGIPNGPADIYKECEILVIDDIGTQIDKEWQEQEFFKLINTRMSNYLITIYTSNIRPEDLKFNDRIKSRIIASTIPFALPEVSIRQMKANQANNSFISRVLGE